MGQPSAQVRRICPDNRPATQSEGHRCWRGPQKSDTRPLPRRVSTVVVQRFCKPKVGGSNPSPGTDVINSLLNSIFRRRSRADPDGHRPTRRAAVSAVTATVSGSSRMMPPALDTSKRRAGRVVRLSALWCGWRTVPHCDPPGRAGMPHMPTSDRTDCYGAQPDAAVHLVARRVPRQL
jgi:hypothetical protein